LTHYPTRRAYAGIGGYTLTLAELFGKWNKSPFYLYILGESEVLRTGTPRREPASSLAYNGKKRMPRFKPKGVFEQNATADLWRNTLSHISTTFGRLGYLASLRDPNSGIYRHYGLASRFGRDESLKAMRESHEQTFVEWMGLSMEDKLGDLSQCLADVEEPAQNPPQHVAERWLRSRIYRTYVPDSAREMERDLFCGDLEALLEITKSAAAPPIRVS
jgi:hypothetical protein